MRASQYPKIKKTCKRPKTVQPWAVPLAILHEDEGSLKDESVAIDEPS